MKFSDDLPSFQYFCNTLKNNFMRPVVNHNVEWIPFYCILDILNVRVPLYFYLTQSSYHLDLNVNIFEVNGENQNGDQEFKMANPECLKWVVLKLLSSDSIVWCWIFASFYIEIWDVIIYYHYFLLFLSILWL